MQQARREETTKPDAAVNGFFRLLTCFGVFNLNRMALSSAYEDSNCWLKDCLGRINTPLPNFLCDMIWHNIIMCSSRPAQSTATIQHWRKWWTLSSPSSTFFFSLFSTFYLLLFNVSIYLIPNPQKYVIYPNFTLLWAPQADWQLSNYHGTSAIVWRY